MLRNLLTIFLLFILTGSALAWDEAGHLLVARIAVKQLPVETKRELQRILSHHPDPQVRTLETASIWPDLIREREHAFHHHHRFYWHFQNRPIPGPVEDVEDRGRLLEQLEAQTRILADRTSPESQRAVALCWLVHLVGDVHQPLHNGTYISPEFPQGDQGGNLFQVRLGQRNISLHSLWDKVGGRFIEQPGLERLSSYCSWFQQAHPQQSLAGELNDHSFDSWSDEGYEMAREIYGAVQPNISISERTLQKTLNQSRVRVTLAGYRLARLLERSL